MVWIQFAATLVMIVTTTCIGLRLLGVWFRTQRLPEFALALLVLSGGTMSMGLFVASVPAGASSPDLGGALVLSAVCCADLATLMAYGFAWQVFRPESRWPVAGLAGLALVLLATIAAQTAAGGFRAASISGVGHAINILLQGLVYGWVCLESTNYHLRLRRRSRLGLAEPEVMRRFLLFAVATGATAAGVGAPVVTWFAGAGGYDSVVATAIVVPSQGVLTVALWLALWPWGSRSDTPAPELEQSSA